MTRPAPWLLALGGMLVWAVHFFGIYVAASIWLTSDTARVLTALLTLACLGADAWLGLQSLPALRSQGLDRWLGVLGLWSAGLSFLAVLWQGLPALLI